MSRPEHDRRIDYIEIPYPDVADAKRFYGAVFGWTFQDYGPEYAAFNDGRLDGGFNGEGKAGRGGPLVVFYVTNLEGAAERVTASGGSIVQPIFSFPGGRRFHFTDPAGNELAVWSE